MALVSVIEAARLVSRGRATVYRDIKNGRLSKTETPAGETAIDTSELVRVYGKINSHETKNGVQTSSQDSDLDDFENKAVSWREPGDVSNVSHEASGDTAKTQILQERIRSLERILEIEKDLRKVKDQVTDQLKARLADKDVVIKALESQVLLLEYTRPETVSVEKKQGFWSRFRKTKQG